MKSHEYETGPRVCRDCCSVLEVSSGVGTEEKPDPGSFMVCSYCGALGVMQADGAVRTMDAAERQSALDGDAHLSKAMYSLHLFLDAHPDMDRRPAARLEAWQAEQEKRRISESYPPDTSPDELVRHAIPPTPCPGCGTAIDKAMQGDSRAVLKPGALLTCCYCASLLEWKGEGVVAMVPPGRRFAILAVQKPAREILATVHRILDEHPEMDKRSPETIHEWKGGRVFKH